MSKLLDAYEQKGKRVLWSAGCGRHSIFFGLIRYFSMHIFHEKRKTKNEKSPARREPCGALRVMDPGSSPG
jgi:hypothetical protein